MEIELVSQPDGAITSVLCVTDGSVGFNEEGLAAEAQGGSLAAFQQLFESCESKVFRVARRIARSREDGEDIMQDAFVQAYKSLPSFRGESRFCTTTGSLANATTRTLCTALWPRRRGRMTSTRK
jgi:DNA-directed RNA polymerase specialized sigma24 family protein